MKPDGLLLRWSQYGPSETFDRLANAAIDHGMTVFARIDHAALGAVAGLSLRPTQVLLFGNPNTGTMLMQSSATLAIDLPLKAMVWQDDGGKTCVTYYDPVWLAARHALPARLNELVAAMKAGLTDIVQRATGDVRVGIGKG